MHRAVRALCRAVLVRLGSQSQLVGGTATDCLPHKWFLGHGGCTQIAGLLQSQRLMEYSELEGTPKGDPLPMSDDAQVTHFQRQDMFWGDSLY